MLQSKWTTIWNIFKREKEKKVAILSSIGLIIIRYSPSLMVSLIVYLNYTHTLKIKKTTVEDATVPKNHIHHLTMD